MMSESSDLVKQKSETSDLPHRRWLSDNSDMLRRDRIEQLVRARNTNVFEVSKASGFGRTYLDDVLKGKSKDPTISRIAKIAETLGATTSFIIGETDGFEPPSSEEYRLIGAFDIRASAGPGAILVETSQTEPMYQLAFREQWLTQITRAKDEDLAVLFADGDSMEPTLRDGDTMLIDRTQTNVRRPGIYVIGFQGTLNVKRVSVNEIAGTIRISSDNPAYTAYDADPEHEELQVAGRVIWIGRKV